jgi:4-hydroxy-tetrahydrodipicolinate reductase
VLLPNPCVLLLVLPAVLPYVCADNAQFYAENGVPFVMGTTGGDPQKVAAAAEAAGVYAVVSPQMGKQVGAMANAAASLPV